MTETYYIESFIDNFSDNDWRKLQQSGTNNFFQTKAAFDFFRSTGLEVFAYGVKENDGIKAFIGGIIQKEAGLKAHLSARAIIYGGPVFAEDITNNEVELLLTTAISNLKKKSIYIEIRNLNDYSKFKQVFEKTGFAYTPHLNFHLDTTKEDAMRKRMSSSKLRQVKKSLKSGATIIEATSITEIASYYALLDHLYKVKVKTPLPNLDFFTKMFESSTAKFLLIVYNESIIGGIVCPILNNEVIYEWFVCGEDGKHKNIYPSILATWAAMEYAVKNNMKRFDFMGAGKPNEDYGVREFKAKFGGALVEHGRFLHVCKPWLYSLGKTAVKILKKT